jgi:hypothetical protein
MEEIEMTAMKKIYEKPTLEICGSLTERTLGGPGYCADPGQVTKSDPPTEGGDWGSCPWDGGGP